MSEPIKDAEEIKDHDCRDHAKYLRDTFDCEAERYRCEICGKCWSEELPQ